MRIGVIGTGYVGLVSGVMFTTLGHQIVCIDNNATKLQKLKNGECIIYETGLKEYLDSAINSSSIEFTDDYTNLKACEAVFICVGTPANEDGSANLTYVKAAIESCVKNTSPDTLIIIKSTVPPSSAKQMQEFVRSLGYSHKIASNPEFLREGSAVYDFNNPDRIIVGCNPEQVRFFEKIYEKCSHVPMLVTDTTTSELIKYTSNSFLSIKLSFINEMSNLCEKLDADIEKLSEGVGLDKRIGSMFLKAGPGYGGSCFPKDTSALSVLATKLGCKSEVLDSAIKSNLARYELMKDKIVAATAGKNIAVLGVAFKAGTDDVRESPSVEIIKLLVEDDFKISVYDPVAEDNFKKLNMLEVEVHKSIESCCTSKDSVVILTEWAEFAEINWEHIGTLVKNKIVIDLRKIADKAKVKEAGFKYYTIGKAGD